MQIAKDSTKELENDHKWFLIKNAISYIYNVIQ